MRGEARLRAQRVQAYAFDNAKLRAFIVMVDDLMLGDSGLSKLEREMIAVAVSSVNHCHYCLTRTGRPCASAPRTRSWASFTQNYRAADLPPRQKRDARLCRLLTEAPDKIEEEDREELRAVGFTTATSGTSPPWPLLQHVEPAGRGHRHEPNREYHYMVREQAEAETPAGPPRIAAAPAPRRPSSSAPRRRPRVE